METNIHQVMDNSCQKYESYRNNLGKTNDLVFNKENIEHFEQKEDYLDILTTQIANNINYQSPLQILSEKILKLLKFLYHFSNL